MIIESLEQLIFNTPMISLEKFKEKYQLNNNIYAKLENFNLTGSVKDRTALAMIKQAEIDGLLMAGSTIIEATSGNTGIALAMLGRSRGYSVILTMPENMSLARRKLLKSYGAELVLTKAADGMSGAIDEAKRLQEAIPKSVILSQFTNPSNPEIHFLTTGKEINEDLKGHVDMVIIGIGTGGTISGVGRYFKEVNPNVKIIGIEPASASFLTTGQIGTHQIQGIGTNFLPEVLDLKVIDRILTVSDEDAIEMKKNIMLVEGLSVGLSSGAALCGAIAISKEYRNKNIVVILPDAGDRYYGID